MWKLLTGEPYAGEPHVWFGGRGANYFSTPIHGKHELILNIGSGEFIRQLKRSFNVFKIKNSFVRRISGEMNFTLPR